MKVGVAAEVKVAPVRVAAGEEREYTEQQTQDEADEIEDFPRHVISPNSASCGACRFRAGLACGVSAAG